MPKNIRGQCFRHNAVLLSLLLFCCTLLISKVPKCHEQFEQDARHLFDEGINRIEQEDYHEALSAFKKSYQLLPKPSILFNMAMCEQALYRYSKAIETFHRYLTLAGDNPEPDMRSRARQALAKLEEYTIGLKIEGISENAEVFIDGRKTSPFPPENLRFVDPGDHELEINCDGYHPFKQSITSEPGKTVQLSVELIPELAMLHVECDTNDATVWLGEKEIGSCPIEQRVQPGTIWVLVKSPEKTRFTKWITLEAGQTVNINATLTPLTSPPPEKNVLPQTARTGNPTGEKSSLPPQKRVSGHLISGVVAVGLGISSGVVGLTYNIKGQQDFAKGETLVQTAETDKNGAAYNEYHKIKNDRLPDDRLGMALGYGLAGVLFATGVALIIWDQKKSKKEHQSVRVSSRTAGIHIGF